MCLTSERDLRRIRPIGVGGMLLDEVSNFPFKNIIRHNFNSAVGHTRSLEFPGISLNLLCA